MCVCDIYLLRNPCISDILLCVCVCVCVCGHLLAEKILYIGLFKCVAVIVCVCAIIST